MAGRSVTEEDVDKRDDLQGLPQPHGMSQDTAEPRAGMESGQTLYEVVVQEPDTTHLQRERYIHTKYCTDTYNVPTLCPAVFSNPMKVLDHVMPREKKMRALDSSVSGLLVIVCI